LLLLLLLEVVPSDGETFQGKEERSKNQITVHSIFSDDLVAKISRSSVVLKRRQLVKNQKKSRN